jgi:SAM-dependent methyltransferase
MDRPVYSAAVSDLPLLLGHPADPRLLAGADVAVKLLHAVDAVAPVAGAEVVLVGAGTSEGAQGVEGTDGSELDGRLAGLDDRLAGLDAGMAELGGRLTAVAGDATALPAPDASADVVLGAWTVYRGVHPSELAEADRVLRPGGRLVVVHDYGRDDLSRLADPDRPEVASWSRRGGPFLAAGFKIRVVHCWLTFESTEAAAEALEATFGSPGLELAASLKRPRVSYNLAIYHRTRPAA